MEQKRETIRQLRADFVKRWRDLFPLTPTPPIRALSALRIDENEGNSKSPGVPFDEWLASGAAIQLGNSLKCTEEKISQLKDQLSRKTYLRDYLLRLLDCLDESGEVQRSRSTSVSNPTVSSVLDPAVKSLSQRKLSDASGVTNEGGHHPPNSGPTESNLTRDNAESGAKDIEQTTFLPRPLTKLDSCVTSKVAHGVCRGSSTLTVTTHDSGVQRQESPVPCVQHPAVTQRSGAAADIKGTHDNNNRFVQLERSELCDSFEPRKCRQCIYSGTHDNTEKGDSPTSRADDKKHTTLPGRREYSCQRGAAITSNDPPPLSTYPRVTGKTKFSAVVEKVGESTTRATQTEISFSVKEEWVISSTDAADDNNTMFWNRKKASGKRTEESRDRDNSGVLGRYSDTPPDLPVAPLSRQSDSGLTPQNVQYLKLTDGFNIVLGADHGGSKPSPPTRQRRPQQIRQEEESDNNDSNEEEIYDNNTVKRTSSNVRAAGETTAAGPGKTEVTPILARRYENVNYSGGEGVRDKFNPVANVAPSSASSTPSPPSRPRVHALVSRVSSDTTGLRSNSLETNSPPGRHSAKPLPQPRKKLPPLPAKMKPSAVFYVENVARENPSQGVAAGSNNAAATVTADRKTDDTKKKELDTEKGEFRERNVGEGRERSDDEEKNTCGGGGRGPSINAAALPHAGHTQTERDTRAQRAQSNLPRSQCLNTNPPRVDESVPSTSIPPTDDQERNKATAVGSGPGVTTTSPPPHSHSQQSAHRETIALPSLDAAVEEKQKAETLSEKADGQSRLRHDNTDAENSLSEFGVRDLCRATVIGALEINQRLSTPAEGGGSGVGGGGQSSAAAATGGGESSADANMLKFNRHTLCVSRTESSVSDHPAVYRKTDETPSSVFRDSNKSIDSLSTSETMHPQTAAEVEGVNTVLTPLPDYDGADSFDASSSASDTHPTYRETDLDSNTTVTFAVALREKQPPPSTPPKPPKKPRANEYENWTINRAVTEFGVRSDLFEDDDDDDSDNTSPGSTLERQSTTGSKDSGLCVDVPSPGVAVTVVAPRGVVDQRFQEGKIGSLEELNRMHDEDDYVHLSQLHVDTGTQDADSVSIASDIVFIPGSKVPDSPEDERRSMSQLGPGSHGFHTSSSASDDDDQDSPPSVDSSYDDPDGDTSSTTSPHDNMLKMRYLLVTGVLDTEKTYLAILELLLHYKRTLEGSCKTSQPVISEDDIMSIFSNLQQLQIIHRDFVEGLQSKVEHWGPQQTIGDIFKCLVVMFPEFSKYAENYQKAVATIHRCSQESQRFQELAQQIVLTSTTREVTSLEDALFKPVQRLQRNTLVLYDLIKHTPEDHPDFDTLRKALNLSQHNLENFGTSLVPGNKVEERRNLVKSSFLVELVSGSRKLRFIFLFSDVLVCTKREQHRGGKVSFDCKWFIPINELKMDTKFAYQDDMKYSRKDDIDDLKKKLRSVKTEMKMELKKDEGKEKHWSISGMASSRTIEKLKRKINELEAQLILASPRLPFKVWHETGKAHTILMTTDYEREEWREVITSLRRKSAKMEPTSPSAYDVQEMVNSVRELPQVNKIGSALTETDEEAIYGTLNVTIHKMNGLKAPCDTYCCLEMDSYGHFFMKARTHICTSSADPSWNEDFELELEGSQTLRILCYRKGPDKHGDILLGRGALEMSKEWLKGTFQEKTVAMNEYCLVLSVRYTAAEKTMRRTPSKQSTAVFGVKISMCAKRDGKTVPSIVSSCVQEVEKRGMDETGIYRVSGVTSDVQKLKKHFDKNVKVGMGNLSEVDIHSVTGVLKLYLRELPEPLFTEAHYTSFMDALKLSDEEAKVKCMLTLLHNLPDINYYTAVYILEHLLIVSKNEKDNKMTIHNLSTIFGPTLLAPATKNTAASLSEMMSLGAEQCMKQSAVIYFFLSLLVRGWSLRRSSSQT